MEFNGLPLFDQEVRVLDRADYGKSPAPISSSAIAERWDRKPDPALAQRIGLRRRQRDRVLKKAMHILSRRCGEPEARVLNRFLRLGRLYAEYRSLSIEIINAELL